MAATRPTRASRARIGAITVVAVAPVAAVRLSYPLWWPRLPDPLPSHWNARGEVDGTMSLTTFVTIMSTVALAGGLLALVAALGTRMNPGTRRTMVTVGAAVGAFAAALWLIVAGAALDYPDAYQVPSPTWQLALLLPAVAAWAAAGFAAYGPTPQPPAATGRPAPDLPRASLLAGQREWWSEVLRPGSWAYLTLVLIFGGAVVMGVWVNPWVAAPLGFVGLVTLYAFTTWVLVDQRGLHVAFGPWRWPRITVPVREIESAGVTTVRPQEWGGLGYRIRPGARGLILGHGRGVRLELSGARYFVTSTKDPDTVAGLINSLIDQERR